MCNFRVWIQPAEDVHLLQCTKCNTFQIRLRNIVLLFDFASYEKFQQRVAEGWQKIKAGTKEGAVVIPTSDTGIELSLHPEHLRELYHLMDDADTEMRTAQLNGLFYQYD
jgi:hypothetical protein